MNLVIFCFCKVHFLEMVKLAVVLNKLAKVQCFN